MAESAEIRANRVLDNYEEGMPLKRAAATAGMAWAQFFRAKRENQAIAARYKQLRYDRGAAHLHENESIAERILTGEIEDPRHARVAADINEGLAEKYAPDEFGARVNLQVDHNVSITAALTSARARALRPGCDPNIIEGVEYRAIPNDSEARSSDKQSEAPPLAPFNPFED